MRPEREHWRIAIRLVLTLPLPVVVLVGAVRPPGAGQTGSVSGTAVRRHSNPALGFLPSLPGDTIEGRRRFGLYATVPRLHVHRIIHVQVMLMLVLLASRLLLQLRAARRPLPDRAASDAISLARGFTEDPQPRIPGSRPSMVKSIRLMSLISQTYHR